MVFVVFVVVVVVVFVVVVVLCFVAALFLEAHVYSVFPVSEK